MRKFSTPVYLVIGMVAAVVLGSTLDLIDQSFGTKWSVTGGFLLALLAAGLFAAYLVYAYKAWKKK